MKEALHPGKYQIDGTSTAVAKQARRLEIKRPLIDSYNEMFKVCASLYNIKKRFAPTYNVSPLPRILSGVLPLPSVRVATALDGLNKSWGQWHMLKCCLPIMVAGGTVKFHACVSLTARKKAVAGDCVARMLLGEDDEKDEEESMNKRRMSV